MPTASESLRDKMGEMFGDRIDGNGPAEFLKKAGYVLNHQDWTWTPKPGVRREVDMTEDERCCAAFLIDEWDFGPVRFES